MKLLLDTHAFLWMLQAPEKLSPQVAQAHNDPANTLWVSMASLWEIQIKHTLGKLELDIPLEQIVREQLQGKFALLDIRAAHVLALNELPRHHGDPFDGSCSRTEADALGFLRRFMPARLHLRKLDAPTARSPGVMRFQHR